MLTAAVDIDIENYCIFTLIKTILLIYESTFVCPTEITAFSDRMEDFHAINTEIVACSVDSQFTHMAW